MYNIIIVTCTVLHLTLGVSPPSSIDRISRVTCRFFCIPADINECKIEGSCSQICINEKGTYKCECENGYLRDPQDHTRCKAMEGHASLLFSMQHNIRKISLDHHEMSAIINSTKSATAIDFVFRTGMIFWGDVSEKKIYKYVSYHLLRTVVLRSVQK